MILADPIKCKIPSFDALKIRGQEITCYTSLIDSAKGVELMWIAISAMATVLAAIFAVRAFANAQKQLRLAEAQHRYPLLREILDSLRPIFGHNPVTLNSSQDLQALTAEANYLLRMWVVFYPQLNSDRVFERLFYFVGAYFDYLHILRVHVKKYLTDPDKKALCRSEMQESEAKMLTIYSDLTAIFLNLHGSRIHDSKARVELEKMIAKIEKMGVELRELQYL